MKKVVLAKAVPHFDQLGPVWVEAVGIQDGTEVARLSNHLSLPHHQLYEVWLRPEGEEGFTPKSLERACFNRIEELLCYYNPETSVVSSYAIGKQMGLLANFATNLHFQAAFWDYSVQGTQSGQVVSVVFGSEPAMLLVYERGLRFKQ